MNSFISWVGGKHSLRKEIVKRFPQQKNDYYVEVFGGAGWVLFYKEHISGETEVYNDLNGELVNLFRCVKYHCEALQQELQFILNSRKIFDGYKNTDTEYLTDIQRAARFFILIRMSYAAKGAHYGCIKRNIGAMVDYLKDIEKRLQTVCIENKDFNNIIDSFKNKKAFFYLDPPYYGTENFYAAKFTKDDHERLFNSLKNINTKFILTYNDCGYIRKLYNDFRIEEVQRQNNLASKYDITHSYTELIIRNY